MSKGKSRDSMGRFISDDTPVDGNGDQTRITRSSVWKWLRFAISLVLLVLACMPWTFLAYEPAKNFGTGVTEAVRNLTDLFKDTYCNCQLSSPPKMTSKL